VEIIKFEHATKFDIRPNYNPPNCILTVGKTWARFWSMVGILCCRWRCSHGGRVEYVSQYCEKSLISAKMPIEPKVSAWFAKWTQTATVWVQSPTHTKSMDKNRPKLSAVGLPFFAADSKTNLRFKSNPKADAVGMPLSPRGRWLLRRRLGRQPFLALPPLSLSLSLSLPHLFADLVGGSHWAANGFFASITLPSTLVGFTVQARCVRALV
jgi:hypothetical protein